MSQKTVSVKDLQKKLNGAIVWPIVAEIIFAAVLVLSLIFAPMWSIIIGIGFGVFSVFFILVITIIRKRTAESIMEFVSGYSSLQKDVLNDMSLDYAVLDLSGKVLFMNAGMKALTGLEEKAHKNIATVFKDVIPSIFPKNEEDTAKVKFVYDNRVYKAEIKRKNDFIFLCLFDETKVSIYKKKIKEDSVVIAFIEIDNFDEVIESIDDLSQSYIIGEVDKKINDYFTAGGGFIRKTEKDRYVVTFSYLDLLKFKEDKFKVLEDVKSIFLSNGMTVTLSIGVGTGEKTYGEDGESAKKAMDLALGRGGDQAVVKEKKSIEYFGGRSQQMERNTRVKVRVKAHALKQILNSSRRVIIMGHKLPDIDAFGAAIGMYCFARELGKEAYIVINDVSGSIKPFYDRFMGREGYDKKVFIKSEEAGKLAGGSVATTVVVVDVNKQVMVDCPEILDKDVSKVVFDHHRTSKNAIQNTVLSYVDSFASSTCEMITEMLQFVDIDIKLKGFEADAIYAGIVVDTDNFNNKTGPRTFDAAAYLRRNGADVTRVRKLMRTDVTELKAVLGAVENAEIYKHHFAFARFEDRNNESPTVGCAKAANQLLDIAGIKASFAVTKYSGKVFVSARSIDEVNVQLIMEKLGGGGHLNIAGAQLVDVSENQAIETIKKTLDIMIEKGEI